MTQCQRARLDSGPLNATFLREKWDISESGRSPAAEGALDQKTVH